jgi:hypothetical protein
VSIVDSSGDLQIVPTSHDHVVVRIPLAERSGPWTSQYLSVARAESVPAEAQEVPGGLVLVVRVPVGMTRQETADLLDTALGLIDKAKAGQKAHSMSVALTEEYIQEWWTRHLP